MQDYLPRWIHLICSFNFLPLQNQLFFDPEIDFTTIEILSELFEFDRDET